MQKDSIRALHLKYCSGNHKDIFFDVIWTHSVIVKEIALLIAQTLNEKYTIAINKELLCAGALVHDIGVYLCYDKELNHNQTGTKYILHGMKGYTLLKHENIPESIARFALVHTGTGITISDIRRDSLSLPPQNFIPITLEEEIVTYADKFHTKHPKFLSYKEQKLKLSAYDPSKGILLDRLKMKFGIPDLTQLQIQYKPWEKEISKVLDSLN